MSKKNQKNEKYPLESGADIDERITKIEKTIEALTSVLEQARTSGGHMTIGSHELRTAVKNRVVLDLIDRGEDI